MIEKYNHSNWNTFNSISSSERIIGCWKISAQYNLGHFVSHRFSNRIICVEVVWKKKGGERKKNIHTVVVNTVWHQELHGFIVFAFVSSLHDVIGCSGVWLFPFFGEGMDFCGNHCSPSGLALLKINGNLFFFLPSPGLDLHAAILCLDGGYLEAFSSTQFKISHFQVQIQRINTLQVFIVQASEAMLFIR